MDTPVFINEHFVAVDKPTGWLTVPSRWGARDPRPCLGITLEEQHGRLWPIHRLDEEVSGLVLFARNASAHRVASSWFETRVVKKVYSALSAGPSPALGLCEVGTVYEWECHLLRGKKRAYESPVGKQALTRARVAQLESIKKQILWELEPLTGRSHQLRYELARQGCPILGDALYGSPVAWEKGIALRSIRLDFSQVREASQKLGLPETLERPPFILSSFLEE